MNEIPPNQDQSDDVDEYYRRTSTLDPSQPSESVRRAVLVHAAQLAAERTAREDSSKIDSTRPAANQARWRPAIFGTLAAAALAGLLITPQFLAPSTPSTAALPPVQVSRPGAPITPVTRAPAMERSPSATAQAPPPSLKSTETQRAATNRIPARDAVPKSTEGYTPPNEDRPARDALAAIAARNTSTPSDGAVAKAMRTPHINSPINPISAPALPAAAPMQQTERQTDSATALRQAAEVGDIPKLQTLLDARVDINARDASGRTPLMLATLYGQANAVDMLLARGADPNAADAHGTTPLQAAVAGNQPAIITALQRAGAR